MELILWRHAEAEAGEPDLGRRLSAKGEKQARRMAEWLHSRLPDSARILASPATRAQQTARALADLSRRKFKTLEQIAPGATAEELLAAVGWPGSRSPVVAVGPPPPPGLGGPPPLPRAPRPPAREKKTRSWATSPPNDALPAGG